MGWFDSHCHVQEEFLDGEREGEAKGRGEGTATPSNPSWPAPARRMSTA